MLTVYMSSVTKGLSAVHDVIECAPRYSASCPVVPEMSFRCIQIGKAHCFMMRHEIGIYFLCQ